MEHSIWKHFWYLPAWLFLTCWWSSLDVQGFEIEFGKQLLHVSFNWCLDCRVHWIRFISNSFNAQQQGGTLAESIISCSFETIAFGTHLTNGLINVFYCILSVISSLARSSAEVSQISLPRVIFPWNLFSSVSVYRLTAGYFRKFSRVVGQFPPWLHIVPCQYITSIVSKQHNQLFTYFFELFGFASFAFFFLLLQTHFFFHLFNSLSFIARHLLPKNIRSAYESMCNRKMVAHFTKCFFKSFVKHALQTWINEYIGEIITSDI